MVNQEGRAPKPLGKRIRGNWPLKEEKEQSVKKLVIQDNINEPESTIDNGQKNLVDLD